MRCYGKQLLRNDGFNWIRERQVCGLAHVDFFPLTL